MRTGILSIALLASFASLASFALFAACRAHDPAPTSALRDPVVPSGPLLDPARVAEVPPATTDPARVVSDVAPAAETEPARVEQVDVEKDLPASVVRGREGQAPHIVFLPGVCSSAYAYLVSFAGAARAHGGVVGIDGDKPCGAAGSGFRSFSWDPVRQDTRLQAALAAAGVSAPSPEGLTLVGYSAGAGIGELMVQRWPKRYARVVLIGAPSDPSPLRLAGARGVVTMSCSRDVPGRMRDAARRIVAAGVPATYLEMPGCTHGNVADGERVFETAFDWLADHAGG
jgi:pimeloyl-ACP methyl ester carboxylesterase